MLSSSVGSFQQLCLPLAARQHGATMTQQGLLDAIIPSEQCDYASRALHHAACYDRFSPYPDTMMFVISSSTQHHSLLGKSMVQLVSNS